METSEISKAIKHDVIPSFSASFSQYAVEKERPACLIRPAYASRGISSIEFNPFIYFIEQIIRSIIPEELIFVLGGVKKPDAIKKGIAALNNLLPLIACNQPDRAPCTLTVASICPSEFTGGVGRYLCDTFSRWLIPGKFLNISSVHSLSFSFIALPETRFFFQQMLVDVHSDDDLLIVKNNSEALRNEVRLNILAVKHARQVVATKKLSSEEKKAIIEENISSVIDRSTKDIDHKNAFDQMHNVFLHLTAEDRITQIKEQFLPMFEQRPKAFDRDIYNDIKHFVMLVGEKFMAHHDLRYVSRLISYQYLFRKTLKHMLSGAPDKRHLSFKLLKTQLAVPTENKKAKSVLGIIGGINVLRENELFEERHIVQAIRHCLPHIRKIEGSFILDRRSHDPVRIFYIEIEKKDGSIFTTQEMRELQNNLPREIKESVESVIHPVFMPRNEEEVMRNILLLSQQLKFVSDIPQVIISFDSQNEESLFFTVILLRLHKEKDRPLKELFSSSKTSLTIKELETKPVGKLRKKHVKESNVFKVSLHKKKFLRKDFSIDLFKARQAVSLELETVFGGIRDYNGGILSKQLEVFQALQELLHEATYKDFLLENFFYSLTPPLRQSLIPPSVLKTLFLLMLEGFETNFKSETLYLKAQTEGDQILIMSASPHESLKDEIIAIVTKLHIPSSDLSYTHVNSYGITCLGYIYQNRSPSERNTFYSAVSNALIDWKTRLKK